jgi:ATP-dependent helicase/nuclease subunit A
VAELGIEPAELVHFFGQLCRFPDLDPYVDGPDAPPDLDSTVQELREAVRRWRPALPDDPADGDAKPGTAANTLRHAERMLEVRPFTDPAAQAEFIGLFDGITKTDRRKSTETTIRGDLTKSHWLDADLADRLDNELLPALEADVVAPALRRWRAYAHRQLVEFVRPAVERYAEHRRQTGQLTFQDLLVCTRDLLRDHPDARRALQTRFPRLLVDEFQDTDPIQAELLFYLASRDAHESDWRACRPRDGSLFIVGDDKQSIYRFRRADLDVYSTVRRAIDAAPNGEDVTLQTNFRSVPAVLDWCNDTFGTLFDRLEAPYQADYVSFEAGRTSDERAGEPVHELRVPYVKGSSSTRKIARRNADQIAALIAEACAKDDSPLRGDTPGDFMVLTRNTTRLDEFAEALAEQGLPYTLTGGDDVQASTELYGLVTLLTCVERPRDAVARLAYLRGPLVGLSDDALYRFQASGGTFDGSFTVPDPVLDGLAPDLTDRVTTALAHLRTARDRLQQFRPAAALEQIIDDLGLMARTRRDDGMGSLHAGRLLRVLAEVERLDAEGHPWTSIREELQRILDGERELDGLTLETGAADAVQLLNVHKAKGLEAPVVFLADPYGGTHPKDPDEHVRRDEGDVVLPVYQQHRFHRSLRYAPAAWDSEFQDVEAEYQWAEEQRLLYVAATRAEDQLVVSRYRSDSWSQEKGYWAPLYPFVDEAPALDPPADPPPFQTDAAEASFSPQTAAARRTTVGTPTYQTDTVTEAPRQDKLPFSASGYGSDFGTAVHRIFQYAIDHRQAVDAPEDLSPVLDAVLDDQDVSHQRETAREMVGTLLRSDLWAALQSADVVHTELPVAGCTDDDTPTVTDGTIDLIYRDPDGDWHLVDFKTEPVPPSDRPAFAEQHSHQLRAYARFWADATGTPIEPAQFWLADSGSVVSPT